MSAIGTGNGAEAASADLVGRIPYITRWSAEGTSLPRLVVRGGRASKDFLGYRRERSGDRDANRVLWRRAENRRGFGKPEFGKVHPVRQRRAVGGWLCSVCGRPTRAEAARSGGFLFVMSRDEYDLDPQGPIDTMEPPVCRGCAHAAVRQCPHLRGRFVAMRCPEPRVMGVYGQVFLPVAGGELRPVEFSTVPRADWRIRWVIAQALVARLETYLVADLDADPLRPTDDTLLHAEP